MDSHYRDHEIEALVARLSPELLRRGALTSWLLPAAWNSFEREAIAEALLSTRKLWLSVLEAQRSTLETSYGIRLRAHLGSVGPRRSWMMSAPRSLCAYLDSEIETAEALSRHQADAE